MDRIPEVLVRRAEELESYYGRVYPELAPMVKQCFLSTIETTVKKLEDGSYFVITGDILLYGWGIPAHRCAIT